MSITLASSIVEGENTQTSLSPRHGSIGAEEFKYSPNFSFLGQGRIKKTFTGIRKARTSYHDAKQTPKEKIISSKTKKKVTFVDKVKEENLVEEILIESFKKYNKDMSSIDPYGKIDHANCKCGCNVF